MNKEAWRQLHWGDEDAEYEDVWRQFSSKFQFRPSIDPGSWPSIQEPTPSITYDLSSAMIGKALLQAEVAFGTALLGALQRTTASADFMYALDWQHAGYAFMPHLESPPTGLWDWPVPALPNGDYYIFVARDLSWGVFGHPWEETWCVFGMPIVEDLRPPAAYASPVVRRDGRSIV